MTAKPSKSLFENYIGHHLSVEQKDGSRKYGILKQQDPRSIKLVADNGREFLISKDSIKDVVVGGKK